MSAIKTGGLRPGPDQVFLTYDETLGYSVYLPPINEEEKELPKEARALIAVGLRLREEPGFVQEMLDWLVTFDISAGDQSG